MRYRPDRKGNQISQLGYGCMRFSRKGNAIDYEKAEKEVLLAIEKGVNYLIPHTFIPAARLALVGFWKKTSAVTRFTLRLNFRSILYVPMRQLIRPLTRSFHAFARTILTTT